MSWMIPRLVGFPKALELMMSGRTFSAEEADAIADAAQKEIQEAVEFALASSFRAPERATDYVYA